MSLHDEYKVEDLRCPDCGHEGSFGVELSVLTLLTKDGPDSFDEWAMYGDGVCTCNGCGLTQRVEDFVKEYQE